MRTFDYTKLAAEKWDYEILKSVAAIHECKARQELFLKKKNEEAEGLAALAPLRSVASNCAVMGTRHIADRRLKALAAGTAEPRDDLDRMIAGYRVAVTDVAEHYAELPLTRATVLRLYGDLCRFSGDTVDFRQEADRFTAPGRHTKRKIRFKAVEPYDAGPAVDSLCYNYRNMIDADQVDPLILIPCFLHDFLCVRPFDDGNGRMARLLLNLLLCRAGFTVGLYVSLEAKIAQDTDAFYEALSAADEGWNKESDDPLPFIKYVLALILEAYRTFEQRVDLSGVKRDSVTMVADAVRRQSGKFTKKEILELCPGIGRASVENALRKMVEKREILRLGNARATYYVKAFVLKRPVDR